MQQRYSTRSVTWSNFCTATCRVVYWWLSWWHLHSHVWMLLCVLSFHCCTVVQRCRWGLLYLTAAGAPFIVRSNSCYSNSITFNSYQIDFAGRLHAVVGQPSLKVWQITYASIYDGRLRGGAGLHPLSTVHKNRMRIAYRTSYNSHVLYAWPVQCTALLSCTVNNAPTCTFTGDCFEQSKMRAWFWFKKGQNKLTKNLP